MTYQQYATHFNNIQFTFDKLTQRTLKDSNLSTGSLQNTAQLHTAYQSSGWGGIRTHVPVKANGFQDRLVMTTSIPNQAIGNWRIVLTPPQMINFNDSELLKTTKAFLPNFTASKPI